MQRRPVRAVWTWPLRCVDAVRMFRAATRFQLGQPEDLQRQLGRAG